MLKLEKLGLDDFLGKHCLMQITSLQNNALTLQGKYTLHAKMPDGPELQETFHLKIVVPANYPKDIPKVYELGKRIPRIADNHIYDSDNFCMGSPLRLKMMLSKQSSLSDFSEKILAPFLYSFCYKEKYGKYPYGELAHNTPGLVDDYINLFKVRGKEEVLRALEALSCKRRIANKILCPCSCNQRLNKCDYRHFLNQFRDLEGQKWFREQLKILSADTSTAGFGSPHPKSRHNII